MMPTIVLNYRSSIFFPALNRIFRLVLLFCVYVLMLIALRKFFNRGMLLDVPADTTQNILIFPFYFYFLVLLMFHADSTVFLLDIQLP